MKLVIMQLIVIVMLLFLLMTLWMHVVEVERADISYDETFWIVEVQNVGKPPRNFSYFLRKQGGLKREIQMPLGVFFAGNRWVDGIYLGTGGQRVRLFLNVQKNEIVMTVLEGSIQTRNGIQVANQTEKLSLNDYSKIIVGDLELQFCKRRGKK